MNSTSIRRVFHLILGLTYIGVGVFLFYRKVLDMPPWDTVLAIAFAGYGIWRMYRGSKIGAENEQV
jgi:hypothetical protein